MIHLENVGGTFPNVTRAFSGVGLELDSEQVTAVIGPQAR